MDAIMLESRNRNGYVNILDDQLEIEALNEAQKQARSEREDMTVRWYHQPFESVRQTIRFQRCYAEIG